MNKIQPEKANNPFSRTMKLRIQTVTGPVEVEVPAEEIRMDNLFGEVQHMNLNSAQRAILCNALDETYTSLMLLSMSSIVERID